MMTLEQFIAAKPKELRLGQWFVNCYWKGSDENSQFLYQLDGAFAKRAIQSFMKEYQWESLPDIATKCL